MRGGWPRRRTVLVLAGLLLAWPPGGSAAGAGGMAGGLQEATAGPPDPGRLLERAAAAYDSLRTLRARFRQVVEMQVFDPPRRREGEGTWYQKKPGRFRMDFSDPEEDLIVSDGERLWLYYPSTHPGQVIRSELGGGGRGAPMVDLQGRILARAQTHYRASYRGEEEIGGRPAHRISLRPVDEEASYRRAEVWLDAETYLVRQLRLEDRSETVRTITLEALEPGVAIPDSLFRFEPPAGVEVFEG